MEEAAETEVTAVFEEISAHDSGVVEITAAFEISVTIEIVIPIGAIVQVPTVIVIAVTHAVMIPVL